MPRADIALKQTSSWGSFNAFLRGRKA